MGAEIREVFRRVREERAASGRQSCFVAGLSDGRTRVEDPPLLAWAAGRMVLPFTEKG